jgi:hypothetical protein
MAFIISYLSRKLTWKMEWKNEKAKKCSQHKKEKNDVKIALFLLIVDGIGKFLLFQFCFKYEEYLG